jgi:gliding motility-associated-like protein
MVTIVAPGIVPTFNQISALCQNDTAPTFPSSSSNSTPITGVWSPATINTSVVGPVTYTFTPDAGQCAVSTTMTVTVLAPTIATFNQIAAICQGGNAPVLPTSSTNGTPIIGAWSPTTISTANAGTTVYTFTPNSGQCALGTTMSITINAVPVIAPVSAVINVCDSYTLPQIFVGNYFTSPNGVGPITNLILTSSQLVYIYAESGTTPNCTDQESFQVNITPSPVFEITGGCNGSSYVLEVINTNFNSSGASYSWSGPSGAISNDSPILTVTTAGLYTCVISISNGTNPCTETQVFDATASAVNCQIAQGISPNGDGLNDTFDLAGFNVAKLSIFNRYGKTVYSRGDYVNEWGGQSDAGNELPDGTYYYVIERNDGGDTRTGWIYINREIR